jgi:putative membrane protein
MTSTPQWTRLDPRMLVVGPMHSLLPLLPAVALVLITGYGDPVRMWSLVGVLLLVVAAGAVRWLTTRYRITAERVELHTGLLRRRRLSVPRDRIRTVDQTAKLLHRVLGLAVVNVSAASGSATENGSLSLNAVSKAEATRLRQVLLDHPSTPAAAAPESELLATLDWRWLRFAPLTFSSLAGVGTVVAGAFNVFDNLGLDPRDLQPVGVAAERLAAAPAWVGVAVVGAVLLVTSVVGALLLFVERWYGYRLTREADRTIRERGGLLTRRSLSISEERLRGVEIVEPLLLRAGGGARCEVLSTGVGRARAVQPPVPLAEANRAASALLREHPPEITGAPLRPHPRAALTRRMSRALVPAAVVVAAAFLAGPADWIGPASLALLPAAALLGLDRYRNLGHQLTTRYLVTRHGSLLRRTAALQRAGVVGWTFRQSAFQRRSGLVTVEATMAAGRGGCTVLDVDAADGVALADAAVPGLLGPFRADATAVASRTGRA